MPLKSKYSIDFYLATAALRTGRTKSICRNSRVGPFGTVSNRAAEGHDGARDVAQACGVRLDQRSLQVMRASLLRASQGISFLVRFECIAGRATELAASTQGGAERAPGTFRCSARGSLR